MSSTKATIITSPEGTIRYMNLTKASLNYQGTREVHTARVELDPTTPSYKAFEAKINAINEDILVSKGVNKGKYIQKQGNKGITASTDAQHPPVVFDKDMNRLQGKEIPAVGGGTAKLLLTEFKGKDGKSGGVNLYGVQLLKVEEWKAPEAVEFTDDEIRKAMQNS